MDTWVILQKELSHYGIRLVNDRDCQIYDDNGLKTQGIIKTLRQIKYDIKQQKELLSTLWKDVIQLLAEENIEENFLCDKRIEDLFIFSLKDSYQFLLCFEGLEESQLGEVISEALNRDIKSFTKDQIYNLPNYKISIDWVHRLIHRLMYISKLLAVAATGKKNVSKFTIKMAKGVSGPWSNLDLPMEERAYPFEDDQLRGRTRDKEKQRRYRQGLENYNQPGVGEGFYWRELKNEPYSWWDRDSEDPYPHRSLLNR